MPAWMHERADHIQAKNPDMPKSEAFAIATQQMHALGKGPKSYGTAEGKRTAKATSLAALAAVGYFALPVLLPMLARASAAKKLAAAV